MLDKKHLMAKPKKELVDIILNLEQNLKKSVVDAEFNDAHLKAEIDKSEEEYAERNRNLMHKLGEEERSRENSELRAKALEDRIHGSLCAINAFLSVHFPVTHDCFSDEVKDEGPNREYLSLIHLQKLLSDSAIRGIYQL